MTKTVILNRINWEPYVDVAIGRMIAMFQVKKSWKTAKRKML